MGERWRAALREGWIRAVEEEKRLLRAFWTIIIVIAVVQNALIVWLVLR